MHELAITESIVSGVRERLGEVRVTRVILDIGKLSAVVPGAIEFCFELCAQGTPLEGAALEIHEQPAAGSCRTCGAQLELEGPIPACPCGSVDIQISSGEQIRVRAVEVA
jgi:hydrogenase nickel incorporation protein HypA/HybF